MWFIMYLITLLLPIVSIPINIFLLVFDYKHKKHYLLLLALGVSFFAYNWKPTSVYDLYGWHMACLRFGTLRPNEMIEYIMSNGEPINNLVKYLVGTTKNLGLLQFSIVFATYCIINNILLKIAEEKKLSNRNFIAIYLLTISSLLIVNFISGLFFYCSMVIFAAGLYEFYKKKTIKSIILFIIAFFIHSSVIFPFIFFIVYTLLCNSKINFRSLSLCVLASIFIGYLIPIFLNNIHFPLFNEIAIMYDGYFKQTVYNAMNSGYFLLFNIIMIIPVLFVTISNKKNLDSISSFGIIITISAFIISIKAPIFIRYIFLTNMLFIPAYATYLSTNLKDNAYKKSNKPLFAVLSFVVIVLATIYQIKLLNDINFIQILSDSFLKTIFSIF